MWYPCTTYAMAKDQLQLLAKQRYPTRIGPNGQDRERPFNEHLQEP